MREVDKKAERPHPAVVMPLWIQRELAAAASSPCASVRLMAGRLDDWPLFVDDGNSRDSGAACSRI